VEPGHPAAEYLARVKAVMHEAAEDLGDEHDVEFLDAVDEEVEDRRPDETGGDDDDEEFEDSDFADEDDE